VNFSGSSNSCSVATWWSVLGSALAFVSAHNKQLHGAESGMLLGKGVKCLLLFQMWEDDSSSPNAIIPMSCMEFQDFGCRHPTKSISANMVNESRDKVESASRELKHELRVACRSPHDRRRWTFVGGVSFAAVHVRSTEVGSFIHFHSGVARRAEFN
jgi:hypothetical protein